MDEIPSRDAVPPEKTAKNMLGNVMGQFNLLAWPRKPLGKPKGKSSKAQNRGTNHVRPRGFKKNKNGSWD